MWQKKSCLKSGDNQVFKHITIRFLQQSDYKYGLYVKSDIEAHILNQAIPYTLFYKNKKIMEDKIPKNENYYSICVNIAFWVWVGLVADEVSIFSSWITSPELAFATALTPRTGLVARIGLYYAPSLI